MAEPVAAILSYDARPEATVEDKIVVVADLGGTRSDVAVVAFFCIPAVATPTGQPVITVATSSDSPPPPSKSMDWWGLVTVVPGLVLFVFALTDSATAPKGFATPYVLVTFIAGLALLAAAVWVEGWVAVDPLLPPDLFHVKGMKLLCAALFLSYGVFGIFLFYSTF